MHYYAAFDCESGGLNPDEVDILTLYASILDEDFKHVDELSLKLKPNDGRIPIAHADALKVNGIDIQKHMEDPETVTYAEGNKAVIQLLKKYYKKSGRSSNIRPMGQNVQFDLDFIWKHLVPRNEWNSLVHHGKIDTKLCVEFMKDCGLFPKELGSLSSVVDYLGIPKRSAHDAKNDTLMCIEVYRRLIDIMKSKKDAAAAPTDIISMLEAE
jgi:DNA polymerase III epsilon subunit-like protein